MVSDMVKDHSGSQTGNLLLPLHGLLLLISSKGSFTCTIPRATNVKKLFFQNVQGRNEMFYLTTHSTHFIYGYMASDIW